jgi:Domain of unknown function (DUF4326)
MTLVIENIPPKVLNKAHGATNGIYVGRPSKFGNPFEIGKDGSRSQVIAKYEAWIQTQPSLIAAAKSELRGHNLICWCAPKACHATILLQLANDID